MRWHLSYRADPQVRALADRHYNRQAVGSPQFVPPGRCLVLKTATVDGSPPDAMWITSWPFAEYVKHRWAGAWMCSAFRNESSVLSSELIREAVSATRAVFGVAPPHGFVTFVDEKKTKKKRDPGRCYRRAGWKPCGYTEGGLFALQQLGADMPEPHEPIGWQRSLFTEVA